MTGRASVLWKTSATHPPKISYNQVEEENQGEPANSGLLGNSLWNGDLLSEGWLMTWRQRAIFTCVSLQSQPCAQWEKCIGSIEYEAWPLHCMTVVSYSVVPAELWQLFQVFLVKKVYKDLILASSRICISEVYNITDQTQSLVSSVIYIIYVRKWYGMVNVDLYSAIITKVSNALDTLVSGEKPGFQTLSEGLVVLLCAEVVRQRVPDHGAVHSECSASDSG